MINEFFQQTAVSLGSFAQIGDWIENIRFLDIKIINISDFTELLLRFILNTGVIFLILQFIYARNSKRKDFYFSYMAVGVIVFLLCFLLNSVKLELGFALGLFAIFGIIRYRTDAIPIKEMTYLFVIIGVSVVNALANKKVSYAELFMTNALIVIGLSLLERFLKLKQEGSMQIVYDNISNVNLNHHDALMEDLKQRTGIEIKRIEIGKIDYLKDIAIITVYFHAGNHGLPQIVTKPTEIIENDNEDEKL